MHLVKNVFIHLILLLLGYNRVLAQYVAPDSLKKIIVNSKVETERIDAMNWLSFRCYQSGDIDSCDYWANRALATAEKINDKAGIGFAYINQGNIAYNDLYNLSEAIGYYLKAGQILEEGNIKKYQGVAYSNIALSYIIEEKYEEAMRYLYKAQRLQSEGEFEFGKAHCNVIFGVMYGSLNETEEALNYYKLAAESLKKQGEIVLLFHCYLSMGDLCMSARKYREAFDNYQNSKNTNIINGDNPIFKTYYNWSHAGLLQMQADSFYKKNTFPSSQLLYKQSREMYIEVINQLIKLDTASVPFAYIELGGLYKNQKLYTDARNNFEKAVYWAHYIKKNKPLSIAYKELSLIDSVNGRWADAYINLQKHTLYEDSFDIENIKKKAFLYKSEFEKEKLEDEMKLLVAEKNLEATLTTKKEQQRNFALAGIALLILAGSYGFIRYRQRKKNENNQALLLQKQVISRDLHDEIGATLSGIAMYSHMVKTSLTTNNTDMAVQSAGIIQESSTEMVNKLNDIVWLIKPQNESMAALIEKLKNYATEICGAKNIQADIHVTERVGSSTPPLNKRKNIYLICKEAINNAVKYSDATKLILHFFTEDKWLHITIEDNGKGFNPEDNKNGNGLVNMQVRAMEIGASLNIKTAPKTGCVVEFKLKIPH